MTVSPVQPHQSFVISKSVLFFLCAEGPLCLGETCLYVKRSFPKRNKHKKLPQRTSKSNDYEYVKYLQ